MARVEDSFFFLIKKLAQLAQSLHDFATFDLRNPPETHHFSGVETVQPDALG